MDPLEVNGSAPNLAGEICEALTCIEYRHRGAVADPANLVFIRANGGRVHRLSFDHGIIFWRPDVQPSTSFLAPDIGASYESIDLGAKYGLAGLRIASCAMSPVTGGSKVTLTFVGGRSITFQNVNDVTTYVAA